MKLLHLTKSTGREINKHLCTTALSATVPLIFRLQVESHHYGNDSSVMRIKLAQKVLMSCWSPATFQELLLSSA